MLWYKAWLETRWRFVFMIGSILLVLFTGRKPELGSALLYCVAGLYLAGAGINSQTTYAATTGFHGSMLFTLSLPVSRRRLFFVRAGLGALETCALVAALAGLTLLLRPAATSSLQILQYATRAVVCTMAVYALSALLACVLDEMWQFTGSCICLAAIWILQNRIALVSQLSPLRGMSLMSYPASAPMPWGPVLASALLTGMLFWAAVLVLQRNEY